MHYPLPPESPDAECGSRLVSAARRDPEAAYAEMCALFPQLAARDRDHKIEIRTREYPRHCKTCFMTAVIKACAERGGVIGIEAAPQTTEVPYVKGMENPGEAMRNGIRWPVKHGYTDDVRKTVGGNALRVLKETWAR